MTIRQGSLVLHLQKQQKEVKDLSHRYHTCDVGSDCLPGPRKTSGFTGSGEVNYFLSPFPWNAEDGMGWDSEHVARTFMEKCALVQRLLKQTHGTAIIDASRKASVILRGGLK